MGTKRPGGIPRQRGNQRGQALIELAVSILLFFGITFALVTVGHAFLVVNMITHAARDGARLAATWPYRGACKAITNYSPIQSTVQTEIATVTGGTFTCTGQTLGGAPTTVCDCLLTQYSQGQSCSGNGGNTSVTAITQTPTGSQNSCMLAQNSNDAPWFRDCPGVGQGSGTAPLISTGDSIPLDNGQVTPVLRDFQACVNAGVHDYVIPVIHCPSSPSCSIGNCTGAGQVVGFATIRIAQSSDIDASGSNKSIAFTQICNNNAPGTGGAGGATCFGQGNATLVDDRG